MVVRHDDGEARRIGDNVRRARRSRGLSLETLAGLAGRSSGWLSNIERGLRPLERRSDIADLANALGVSPADLLRVDTAPLTTGRHCALRLETARAYRMLGRGHETETVRHLREAERLAADRVHHNPIARELIADMLCHARRTAGSRDLRGMAWRMNITA